MNAKVAPSRALVDPVCRMTLTSGNLRTVRMVEGQAVYFCSPQCARKFDIDPERYLANTAQHVELPLYGLLRSYEAANLESELQHVEGVQEVSVDPLTEVVDVTYDGGRTSVAELGGAIERAGYRLR
jgi:YHS domain-containing protein/copper chaperone CopZ